MLDIYIMKATGNKKKLRDVCVLLYERFGKKNKGYGEQDIVSLVNEMSGQDFTSFFNNYVYTASDFEVPLKECFEYLDIEFVKEKSAHACEHYFGFKVMDNGPFARVTLVAPFAPAWKSGLFAGDEIIAVNGLMLKNNFHQWLGYFLADDQVEITVNSNDQLKTLSLQKDKKGNTYFFDPVLKVKGGKESSGLSANFEAWQSY